MKFVLSEACHCWKHQQGTQVLRMALWFHDNFPLSTLFLRTRDSVMIDIVGTIPFTSLTVGKLTLLDICTCSCLQEQQRFTWNLKLCLWVPWMTLMTVRMKREWPWCAIFFVWVLWKQGFYTHWIYISQYGGDALPSTIAHHTGCSVLHNCSRCRRMLMTSRLSHHGCNTLDVLLMCRRDLYDVRVWRMLMCVPWITKATDHSSRNHAPTIEWHVFNMLRPLASHKINKTTS